MVVANCTVMANDRNVSTNRARGDRARASGDRARGDLAWNWPTRLRWQLLDVLHQDGELHSACNFSFCSMRQASCSYKKRYELWSEGSSRVEVLVLLWPPNGLNWFSRHSDLRFQGRLGVGHLLQRDFEKHKNTYMGMSRTWFGILGPEIVRGTGKLLAAGESSWCHGGGYCNWTIWFKEIVTNSNKHKTRQRVMRLLGINEQQTEQHKFICYVTLTLINFPAAPCFTFG